MQGISLLLQKIDSIPNRPTINIKFFLKRCCSFYAINRFVFPKILSPFIAWLKRVLIYWFPLVRKMGALKHLYLNRLRLILLLIYLFRGNILYHSAKHLDVGPQKYPITYLKMFHWIANNSFAISFHCIHQLQLWMKMKRRIKKNLFTFLHRDMAV